MSEKKVVYQARSDQFDNSQTGYHDSEEAAITAFWTENRFTESEVGRARPYANQFDGGDPEVIESARILAQDGSPSPAIFQANYTPKNRVVVEIFGSDPIGLRSECESFCEDQLLSREVAITQDDREALAEELLSAYLATISPGTTGAESLSVAVLVE